MIAAVVEETTADVIVKVEWAEGEGALHNNINPPPPTKKIMMMKRAAGETVAVDDIIIIDSGGLESEGAEGEWAVAFNVDGIVENDGNFDDEGVHFVLFLENLKFRTGFGAGIDFLDPSRVESIDKRLILCLDSMLNR